MDKRTRLTIGIAGLVVFAFALILLLSGHTSSIDDPIRHWFYDLRRDGLNDVIAVFTLLGNWQSITAICIVLLLIPGSRRSFAIPASAGVLAITILNKIIKHLVQRPRPDDIQFLINEGGFSFPSGHSIASMFFYGLLLCLVLLEVKNKTLKIILSVILIILTFGIGLSRIYLGVHYPTDVLAGWALGAAGISIVIAFAHREC
ncbi:MAG: phosphatase PAP2 family protein [Bacillota bacterium]|nr:phosphatase PAP2 family protein [Bacillota bacterium]